MHKYKLLLLFGLFLFGFSLQAQPADAATWVERLVTTNFDNAEDIVHTSDGNIVVGGEVNGSDIMLAKLDPDGRVIWLKAYNAGGADYLKSLQETSDGGLIMGCYTDSSGSGTTDYLFIKTDADGNIQFSVSYDNTVGGASGNDFLTTVKETSDGGYLLAGYTTNVTSSEGWIIKLNSNSSLAWNKTFGGADEDYIMDFIENPDGSIVFTGYTLSFPTAPLVPGTGEYRGWLLKTDSAGNQIWSQAYEADDPLLGPATKMSLYFNNIERSSKVNHYIVSGKAQTRNIGSYTGGLLFQVDATGNVDADYGYEFGAGNDFDFHDMMASGSYSIAAEGNFDGANIAAGLISVEPLNLDVSMAKTYDHGLAERAYSIDSAPDGGFVLGGGAMGLVVFPAAKHRDFWMVKVDDSGDLDDPNCANTGDYTATTVKTALTTAATATPAFTVSENSGVMQYLMFIVNYRPLAVLNTYCAACLAITGGDPMDAGAANELTIDAHDSYGNPAALYSGAKNLVFSGLNPVGTYNPEVEGTDFGTTSSVNFTAGTSDPGVATLTAYAAETSTVHVTDGYATSEAWEACADNGLPLTVNLGALDHYSLTATTPQQTGFGWQETVRAEDLYGNLRGADAHAFNVTNTGSASFFTDNTYGAATASYNLAGGLATIFIKDLVAETITITAADAGLKTGTSGPITVANPPPVAGGRSGGGGGSSPAPQPAEEEDAAVDDEETALHESAEEEFDEASDTQSFENLERNEAYLNLSCLKKQTPDYSFDDMAGHFSESAVALLMETLSSDAHVTQGYDDNGAKNFKPDQPVTRAEFLKMAMLANCVAISEAVEQSADGSASKVFGDVPLNGPAWYTNHVYSALAAGIVDGAADGNFYPDRPITRAEATKILVNVQHLIDSAYTGTDYFADVDESDWFFIYVSAGKENEIIYGSKDATGNEIFKPNDNISRGETALILVRIFNLRDYVTFTDPNARDYKYVSRGNDATDGIDPSDNDDQSSDDAATDDSDDLKVSVLDVASAKDLLPTAFLLASAGMTLAALLIRRKKK